MVMLDFAGEDPEYAMGFSVKPDANTEADPFDTAAVPESLERSLKAVNDLGCISCDAQHQDSD